MVDEIIFEFKDLDDFKEQLAEVASEYPLTCEKHLKKIAKEFKNELKEKSPDHRDVDEVLNKTIKKGYKGDTNKLRKKIAGTKLKNMWHTSIKGCTGQDLELEVFTKSKVFHLVDRGHEKKSHKGKYLGFKDGTHFFEKVSQDIEHKTVPKEIDKLYSDIKRKIEK